MVIGISSIEADPHTTSYGGGFKEVELQSDIFVVVLPIGPKPQTKYYALSWSSRHGGELFNIGGEQTCGSDVPVAPASHRHMLLPTAVVSCRYRRIPVTAASCCHAPVLAAATSCRHARDALARLSPSTDLARSFPRTKYSNHLTATFSSWILAQAPVSSPAVAIVFPLESP